MKNTSNKQANQAEVTPTQAVEVTEAETNQPNSSPEVTTSTKVKVVAALLVVGFAAYVAYWVQEPTDLRADVLSATQESTATSEIAAMDMPLTTETAAETIDVSIHDFSFDPAAIEVTKGTTVRWTNNDDVPHTVTGDQFTSGTLNKGETYEYTFSEDGEYAYTCSFHPQMQGKVTVGAVATSEEVTVPPLTTDEPVVEIPTPLTEEVMPVETTMTIPEAVETPPDYVPLDELAPAAPEAVETSVATDVVTTSVTSKALSGGNLTAEELAMQANHGAAVEGRTLSKSGPEDIVYVAMFVGILFLTRKKAFGLMK